MTIFQRVPCWGKGVAKGRGAGEYSRLPYQAMPGSVGGSGSTVRGVRFIEDIGHVRGDGSGLMNNASAISWLLCPWATQTQHLHFACRETIWVGWSCPAGRSRDSREKR